MRLQSFFLIIFLLSKTTTYAANEEYINTISGSLLHINSILDVADEKFQTPYWTSIEKNISVTDLVIFEINDEATVPLTQPFTCKIDLQIVSYNSDNIPTTILKSLKLSFDPAAGKTYKSKQVFKFINGHHLVVTVQSISYTVNEIPQTPPPVFKLTNKILISRIYKLDCGLMPDPNHIDTALGFLEIMWMKQIGAEEYDLEWTFLDDSSELVMNNTSVLFSDLFKQNATRVNTPGTSYRLRRAYPKGYLYYRVRAVHYTKNRKRQNGAWSGYGINGPVTAFNDSYHNKGWSTLLNWQYNVSFAEDGKKSEGISYFDGTLRNREALRYNNSNRQVIVGETFYDHIGRAAVQTMPVPVNDSTLSLKYPFNISSGASYNFMNWETGSCSTYPSAMDTSMGAAFYYSSNNTDTFNFQKYLPRAYGYPFAVTEFTPDNTNRVHRQSGVGKNHQLGLHDTRYFYGKPEQKDLDRIFGNEAGYSARYLKNMVVDANGQISISYIDAHGRTIATALAGDVPLNLSSLTSNSGALSVTYNLLDNNLPFNYGKLNTHKILGTNNGTYNFNYSATPPLLKMGCATDTFCYDAYYDLKITVTDDCMNGGMPDDEPYIFTANNYSNNGVFTFDTLCSVAAPAITAGFNLSNLPPGGYNTEKKLTVSEAAVDFYTAHFLRNNQCLIDSETFIQNAIASIDFSGCDISCEECFESIGEQDTFISNYLSLLSITDTLLDEADTAKAISAYDAAVKGCEETCNGKGTCEALLGTLLSDVYPGHQWAQYIIDINGNYQPKNNLSALYYYQNVSYFDDNGAISYVLYNGSMVPANMLPLKNFVLSFRPSWANSLVKYHPEYCYYSFCTANATSNAYDDQMMLISSFTQANAEGYLKPVPGNTNPYFLNVNQDPFFLSGGSGQQYSTQIQNELLHYIDFGNNAPYEMSAWDFAMATVNSINNTNEFTTSSTDYTTGCSGNKDAAWSIFRSIYQTLKFKYIDYARETYVLDDNNGPGNGLGCNSNLCMTLKYDPLYLGSLWSGMITGSSCLNDPYYSEGYVPRVFHYEAGLSINSATDPDDVIELAQQYAAAGIAAQCEQSCSQQADYWIQQLSGCSMTSTQEAAVRAGLIEVCIAGCDFSHPYGASTTPDGTASSPNGYKSFQEVLEEVLNVSPTDQASCNALMIGSPGPYNSAAQNNGYILYTKDDCVCEKFDALQDSFSMYGGFPNLAGFINAHYSSNLTQDEVNGILSMCNDPDCNFLSQPVAINMALSCDTTGCKNCQQYQAAKFMFNLLYPENDFNDYETYYASYMNQQFGFQLLYNDYMAFEQECTDTVKKSYMISDTASTIITTVTALEGLNGGVSIYFTGAQDEVILLNAISAVTGAGSVIQLDTSFLKNGINYHVIDSILIDSVFIDSTGAALQVNIRNKVFQNSLLVASTDLASAVPCNCEPSDPLPLLPVFGPKLCGDQYLSASWDTVSCHDQLINMAITYAIESYHDYRDSVAQTFAALYRQKAMEAIEVFTVVKPFNEYHYTLYYYDQAGNLVKTIPPAGIALLNENQITSVENHRLNAASPAVFPAHSLASRYWFNTLNAPVKQFTPDADSSRFWYDRLGRMVVSQSARQRPLNQYGYSLYDALGRIAEAGQLVQTNSMTNAISKNAASLAVWIAGVVHSQVTRTSYDASPISFAQFPQSNLRNRVACTSYEETDDGNINTYQCATYYDYDVSGNVKSMRYDIQELANFKEQYKRIDYDYDLISGKVNRLYYQKDSADQFIYWYRYDAMNRVIAALTSKDGFIWETDAGYQYYDHGPLARTELGDRQVQGIDYAYTIEGWMKGINGMDLNSNKDMGADAVQSGIHNHVAKDAFGMVLSYFNGDYSPIGKRNFEPAYANSVFSNGSASLYNGNIRNMSVSISNLPEQTIGYAYKYDQLNRLMGMDPYKNFNATDYKWKTNGTALSDWKEKVSYDANGNILTYIRHGTGSVIPMDSMTYSYNTATNQLNHVDDGIGATNYSVDIDDQSASNYLYDKSGNLIKDVQEGLDIKWNTYGKITEVYDADKKQTINFRYDASGNRMVKQVVLFKKPVINTYYIRDAQGNILATYRFKHPITNIIGQPPKDTIWWEEQHLYGTSRIGISLPGKITFPSPALTSDTATLSYYSGLKNYELTNHLGNVLAVVNDKRIGVDNGSGGIGYYKAEVVSATDYYPFGMGMVGREYSLRDYRFGFNGKEDDNEVEGNGNWQDYGMRMYSPRIGRFPSVDPITIEFPMLTPYQFASNNPIYNIDLDGLEGTPAIGSNPMYILAEGFRQYLDAGLNTFTFNVSAKGYSTHLNDSYTKGIETYTDKTISSNTTSVSYLGWDLYKPLAYSKNATVEDVPWPSGSFKNTTDVLNEKNNKYQIGNTILTKKETTNFAGETTKTTTGSTMILTSDGIPLTFSLSETLLSNGSITTTTKVALGSNQSNLFTKSSITKTNGTTSSSTTIGGQINVETPSLKGNSFGVSVVVEGGIKER